MGLLYAKIDSIVPSYNETIRLETDRLIINYDVSVSLSTRNITIYQANGTDLLMRQTTSGLMSDYCSIDPDNKVVYLKVLSSTFNMMNGEYHLSVSSNFVKHKESDEPIDKL